MSESIYISGGSQCRKEYGPGRVYKKKREETQNREQNLIERVLYLRNWVWEEKSAKDTGKKKG